jgi:predicted dehydrogenase
MKQLVFGQIGCGYWGEKLLDSFLSIQGVTMNSCSDISSQILEKLEKQYSHIFFSQNYLDVLDNPSINAVIIATPPKTHFKLAKEALEKGKNVFIEKPVSMNVNEAKFLYNLSAKNSKLLMVDHTFLYSPGIVTLKKILSKKELGNLLHIEMSWVNLGLFNSDVDVIWDLSPHPLSILLFLLEREPAKYSCEATAHINSAVYDIAHVTALFQNKLSASISLSWLSPIKERRITLIGSDKMATYVEENGFCKVTVYDKSVQFKKTNTTGRLENYVYKNSDNITEWEFHDVKPLLSICEDFVRILRSGNNTKNVPQYGITIVDMIASIHDSIHRI